MRIHDLEPERGPFKARRDFFGQQIAVWKETSEFQDDLRLDPRRHHAAQGEAMATLMREVNGMSIHRSPDRRIQIKFLPRNRVGETDLAADCLMPSFQETFMERTPDPVATL